MNSVKTSQSRCRAAVARCDITPPVGIYHRMWGAAMHDQATGVHRPLEATLLWLAPESASAGESRIIVSLDHCILDEAELRNIRESIAIATSVCFENILITLTHTHGSGWMSRTRRHLPGGELIGPYLDVLAVRLADLAHDAQPRVEAATIVYGTGRCSLAANRDYLDVELGSFVCGFNPTGPSDDTLLVARIANQFGDLLAILVNYACHPTTLAWDNTLLSPDWVGAMREVVEKSEGGYCLFLQGASGDLGPREGYVGDTAVADRNGRQVGFAVLSSLTTLAPVGTEYRYAGPVLSGCTIGTWKHQPLSSDDLSTQTTWYWKHLTVEMPYRHDLPSIEQTTAERDHWLAEESIASKSGDESHLRICRAQIEQRSRQLTRLNSLAPGRSWPLPVEIAILGDALWIFVPGELYQVFQLTLRARFAPRSVVICTLTNDWQPGYIPPASSYGYNIYQEIIAATSPGCLETLIETITREIERMIRERC